MVEKTVAYEVNGRQFEGKIVYDDSVKTRRPAVYFRSMTEDFSRFFKPGRVHRQIYTDPAIFELEMERIFGARLDLHRPRKPGEEARRLFRHADRPPAGGDDARRERRAARDPQPVRPSRRHGGGDRKGQRPTNSPAAITAGPIISTAGSRRVPLNHGYPRDFEAERPEDGDAARCARVKSYRGFVFASEAADGPSLEESLGHMTHVARRHDRPRAGRRDRGGRRRVQARL